MKLLVLSLLMLALALPASGQTVANVDAVLRDGNGNVLSPTDFTLALEAETDATCHYGAATGAVPDTVAWHKHALVWGPTGEPVDCMVEWFVETNVTYGYVQFYELVATADGTATPTYGWGDVFKTFVGATLGDPETKAYFKSGLWDSVRAWAQGDADGIIEITASAQALQ